MTSITASSTTGTDGSTRSRRSRPPATVLVAAGLTALVCLVGSYGAVYFSTLDGITDMGLTFLVSYVPISVFGLVAAVALVRGSDAGRLGVVSYGLWLTAFNAFKIFYIQEAEAIPFGVVGLLILGGVLAPATRRWTTRTA